MDYPRFDLTDQVAIITGASKGIGYGLAKALAHAGAKVAVAARDLPALEKLAQEITNEGGVAYPVELDVRDVGQIHRAFQQAREMLIEVPSEQGAIQQIAHSVKYSATSPEYQFSGADLGQHTHEILNELGLSAEDIQELRATGAFG